MELETFADVLKAASLFIYALGLIQPATETMLTLHISNTSFHIEWKLN